MPKKKGNGASRKRQMHLGVNAALIAVIGVLIIALLAVYFVYVRPPQISLHTTQTAAMHLTEMAGSIIATITRTLTPAPTPTPTMLFSDEFNDEQLDPQWEIYRGSPTIGGGRLVLSGAEIQSKATFQLGILQVVIQSSDWKPQNQFTDSSFGFEIWAGSNVQCHYGVIFKASGHLAVLRSEPDTGGNCSGDPKYQEYIPISNWDMVRAAGTVYFTLTWSPGGVMLEVSDGGANNGQASYSGQALPAVPLDIRLNAYTPNTSVSETYSIDYIRLYQTTP